MSRRLSRHPCPGQNEQGVRKASVARGMTWWSGTRLLPLIIGDGLCPPRRDDDDDDDDDVVVVVVAASQKVK